jgi:hypothetical protein
MTLVSQQPIGLLGCLEKAFKPLRDLCQEVEGLVTRDTGWFGAPERQVHRFRILYGAVSEYKQGSGPASGPDK